MKDFRDPLYGFVSVDDLEEQIIELRSFQRLRHIGQLGTSFLVYPSANHTRFEHSLGTLEASSIVFDRLLGSGKTRDLLGWSEDEIARSRSLLRLASLLHDIGHSPFSHAAEVLLPSGAHHEDFTTRLIRETEIAGLIDSELGQGSADVVANIAVDKDLDQRDHILLSEILTGDIGSDRLDYLRRDSHHLGVAYGNVDLARYVIGIELMLSEESGALQLMIEDGAVHSVEGILLARYFMFLQVYFHKTRRILDRHLIEAIQGVLPDGFYPSDLEGFLEWDDARLIDAFRNRKADVAVRRVLGREHFRCVFETLEHPEIHDIERFDWLKQTLVAKFGADALYVDEASKDPYNFIAPPIQVSTKRGPIGLQERSSLIHSLKPISKMRIYAKPEIRLEVDDECERFRVQREEARG